MTLRKHTNVIDEITDESTTNKFNRGSSDNNMKAKDDDDNSLNGNEGEGEDLDKDINGLSSGNDNQLNEAVPSKRGDDEELNGEDTD